MQRDGRARGRAGGGGGQEAGQGGQGRGEGGRAAKGVPARADRTAHDAAGIAAGVHERVACTNGLRASRAMAGPHQLGRRGGGVLGARTDRPTKRLPKREVASAPEAPVPARACTGRRRRCLAAGTAERSAALCVERRREDPQLGGWQRGREVGRGLGLGCGRGRGLRRGLGRGLGPPIKRVQLGVKRRQRGGHGSLQRS